MVIRVKRNLTQLTSTLHRPNLSHLFYSIPREEAIVNAVSRLRLRTGSHEVPNDQNYHLLVSESGLRRTAGHYVV